MINIVPKRRVSCTSLVFVKASRVRCPLASTQWMLGTSNSIISKSKALVCIRPSSHSVLCCLFKLYMSSAMMCLPGGPNVSTSGFEQTQHQRHTKCKRIFYVNGHLAVRRMHSLTSQWRVIVLFTFHIQRLTPNSLTTALQKKWVANHDRARKTLACLLCWTMAIIACTRLAAIGHPSCNWFF